MPTGRKGLIFLKWLKRISPYYLLSLYGVLLSDVEGVDFGSEKYKKKCKLRDLWFLPRDAADAMHKRGISRHPMSVCVSATFVDHVKTNKHIFEFFSPSGSQAILVFPYQTG